MAVTSAQTTQYPVSAAAAAGAAEVLRGVDSAAAGLTSAEASRRLARDGPNAVRTHRVSAFAVLLGQLRSFILLLLVAAAAVSFIVGERANATIIGVILLLSVGLGFSNEYRAERTARSLHSRVNHSATVLRDGRLVTVPVVDLAVGDVVGLGLGAVVPADLRLLEVNDLQCDESILTGESVPVDKSIWPVPAGAPLAELSCCALMGTVVHAGSGTGVVVATGHRTEFGRIALELGERQPETDFQLGLRRFSLLLLQVALVLTSLIFAANMLMNRPLIDSLLFSLAIAVGITPQLLPAVVSTSLAAGARALARRNVLVKRLVCIEDLGNMDVLVTDKTGTLTEGRISFLEARSVAADVSADQLLLYGLLATEGGSGPAQGVSTAGMNPLDGALWDASRSAAVQPERYTRTALLPFDHTRRRTSVLARDPEGRQLLVVKGAPEDVLRLCADVTPGAREVLDGLFASGLRVIAVAVRAADGAAGLHPDDESGLRLQGFLCFLDRPKAGARESLQRLRELGVGVKVATGDNAAVAEKVCRELGLDAGGTLTGSDVDGLDDAALGALVLERTVFARVSPEQKARIIRLLREGGRDVGFLGDGVNDVLALHQADVGISVDGGTDVAKDAADVVLLEKDLGVLADGITEGRRIFANTIKYVLMGTSSNFGNMFSAAAASAFLPFLPMLPGQILLNNLLYDSSQLAIPSDRVDREQLRRPAHWNIGQVRRFMLVFGPVSSLFDFATFALMLFIFHAGPEVFRSGWFVESLATQTLIVFAIRTRQVPFYRSRASGLLTGAVAAVVAAGIWLPLSPLAGALGFGPLSPAFFLALAVMVVLYLVLIELAKKWFFARVVPVQEGLRRPAAERRVHRRAARFSVKRTGSGYRPAEAGSASRQ